MKYLKLYIKNIMLTLSLFSSIHISYGMEKDAPNDNNRPGTLLADERMPNELLRHIFHYLPFHGLKSVRESSKFYKTQVDGYAKEQLSHVARQLNTFTPNISNDQIGGILSKLGETDKYMLLDLLEKEMEKNQFLLALPKSPMAFHMYDYPGFKPLSADMMVSHIEDAKALYYALFNCDLPTDNPENMQIALDHVLAAWPLQTVFFKKKNEAQGASAFFKTHTQELIEKLSSLGKEKPYVSLMNHDSFLEQMKTKSHNIVVSASQLMDLKAKDILEQLLTQNSDHTIVLSVRPSVHYDSLSFGASNLPSTLKHLRLINPSGDIKNINSNFCYCSFLISIDLSGLTNVITIDNNFLGYCRSLTNVDLSGFYNVRDIEKGFLRNCDVLTSIDLSGLNNVENIDNHFLYTCLLDDESKRKVEAFLEQVRNRKR